MAYNPQVLSVPKKFLSSAVYPPAPFVTPEMFGAKGDGVADDTAALQACITACLNNGYTMIRGGGIYGVTGTIDIVNFPTGLSVFINRIVALAGFPAPANWKTATPVFRFGNTGGSSVGLEFAVLSFDGANKATLHSFPNTGCGGSRFHVGRAENYIGVIDMPGNTFPASSNYITGDFWLSGTYAIRIKGGTAAYEGTTIDVNFIESSKYPSIMLYDGSQYTNIRGQLDFSGTWCSQLKVPSITGWAIGDTVTCVATGATGEVLGTYPFEGAVYLFVAETKDVSSGHSNFAATNTITNGTASTTVTTVITCNESSNNQYYDILSGYSSAAPFSKATIICPYLGGIVGSNLFNCFIAAQNSTSARTNSNQGFMITNSGNGQIDFYNTFLSNSNPFLDVTASLFSVTGGRDFNPGGGTSNASSVVTLPQNVATTVISFPLPGPNGAAWLVNVLNPGDTSVSALAIVYFVGSSSSARISTLDNGSGFLVLAMSGFDLHVTQSPQSAMNVVTNILRISFS